MMSYGQTIIARTTTTRYTQAFNVENELTSVVANGQRTMTRDPAGTLLTLYPFPAYEQSYPAAQNDLFPENAANWTVGGGSWSWNSSQFYVANSGSNAVTTHNSATLGNSGVIAASIRANNNKNGYLVFDYQDAQNYKYIGLDAQTDKWVFGQRVSNANSDLYVVNETIANAQWYDVKIVLSGNTAKLYVNGTFKAQYSYSATFSGGKVGFRAVNANTYFDNFLVSTAETSRTTYTLGGQAIATRVTGDPTATNNGLFYIFSDHLGSTSVLATSNGNQVPDSKTAYYPFGSPRTTPTQTITDRNFTGQKENLELGLIYYNARFYLPAIARFLTPDTLIPNPQSPQSFNRYAYTRNNPINRVDPTGHIDCDLLGDGDDMNGCNTAHIDNYQNNTTVYPAPEITEDEIRLLAIAVFAETSDGTHSTEAIQMLTWAFLNKKAIQYPDIDMFDIIKGVSDAWNDYGDSSDIREAVGDWPINGRDFFLALYENRMSCETANCDTFREFIGIVRDVVSQWKEYGSNSSADPTHGALFFAHQSSPVNEPTIWHRFQTISADFYALALEDPTFNYAISAPYQVGNQYMVAVTGNQGCVSTGSCRPQ